MINVVVYNNSNADKHLELAGWICDPESRPYSSPPITTTKEASTAAGLMTHSAAASASSNKELSNVEKQLEIRKMILGL